MPGLKKYTIEMLQDENKREEIAQALSGKSWEMTVVSKKANYGFLIHPEFAQNVMFHKKFSALGDLVLFAEDGVSVEIGISYSETRQEWAYVAKNIRLKARHIPRNPRALAIPDPRAVKWPQTVSIYIDESWPGNVDPKQDKRVGIIAGVVWGGDSPDYSILPFIKAHSLEDSKTQAALGKLLYECKAAFPFAMPIKAQQAAQGQYFELVLAALKIILFWIIPAEGIFKVKIYLHRHSQFEAGQKEIDLFKGTFGEYVRNNSWITSKWEIGEVKWEQGDFEYIPYADAIAGVAQQHTEMSRLLAEKLVLRKWPGFLPLSLNLITHLGLLKMPGLIDADAMLDLMDEIHGTYLGTSVFPDLKTVFSSDRNFQHKILNALEDRFKRKVRDLQALRRLFDAVRAFVALTEDNTPPRLQLLWDILVFQRANHDGDPERATNAVTHYQATRKKTLPHDPNLVAYADLNLAVHYNDQMDFIKAEFINNELLKERIFSSLTPLMQGRVLSSMGQSYSIQGRWNEAEACFLKAIKKLKEADPFECDQAEEIRQTRTYRAINAMDGKLLDAEDLVGDILGRIEISSGYIAKNDLISDQYKHHLLLRWLWISNGDKAETYLRNPAEWKCLAQHPWEMIALYRGLLLWKQGQHQRAAIWFNTGMAIATGASHGATLMLISAMIGTVAACCFQNNKEIKEKALADLKRAGAELPAAKPAVETLDKVLESPSSDLIDTALRALPFNYH